MKFLILTLIVIFSLIGIVGVQESFADVVMESEINLTCIR